MQSKLDGQNIDREDFIILGDGRIGILLICQKTFIQIVYSAFLRLPLPIIP